MDYLNNHRISKNIFVYGSYEFLAMLEGTLTLKIVQRLISNCTLIREVRVYSYSAVWSCLTKTHVGTPDLHYLFQVKCSTTFFHIPLTTEDI